MVNEKVKEFLVSNNLGDRLTEHPAGGNEFTSVKVTPSELEAITGAEGWCDVCKGWEEDAGGRG